MSDPSDDPQVGDFINITGIQIASVSPFTDSNNKVMTSGRILQEIDQAITSSSYNYVVDQVMEITYTSPEEIPVPAATDVTPDIIFIHVVDLNTSTPNPPFYELLKKVEVSTGTYEYVCNKVPVSSIVLNSSTVHKDIFTLYKYVEEVPDSDEEIPHFYQEWIKTNSAYNYVVNQLTTIEYNSSSGSPVIPVPTETSTDVIFVYIKDTKATEPLAPYYELLIKVKIDDTPTYAYRCYQVPISSIVLDLTNEDIYTLYNYISAVPTPETVPANYQIWVKTDRFNEELQINLSHTNTSLTTKGAIEIDGDSKLTVKDLSMYHQNPDASTYSELTKTDLTLTKSTVDSNVTETNTISMTSNELESGTPTNNAALSVTYSYVDSSQSSNNHSESVIISSHDDSVDENNPGASVVLTGDNSFIETPILRLKIVN